MKTKRIMKLEDIIIPAYFSKPSAEKVQKCMDFYAIFGKLDKDIVVDGNGTLRDGYVRYIVLTKNRVKEVEVIVNVKSKTGHPHKKPIIYVFAKHMSNSKEYCWRITDNIKDVENLQVGNKILVETKFGKKAVTVTHIETLSQPPVDGAVKKVIRCFDN